MWRRVVWTLLVLALCGAPHVMGSRASTRHALRGGVQAAAPPAVNEDSVAGATPSLPQLGAASKDSTSKAVGGVGVDAGAVRRQRLLAFLEAATSSSSSEPTDGRSALQSAVSSQQQPTMNPKYRNAHLLAFDPRPRLGSNPQDWAAEQMDDADIDGAARSHPRYSLYGLNHWGYFPQQGPSWSGSHDVFRQQMSHVIGAPRQNTDPIGLMYPTEMARPSVDPGEMLLPYPVDGPDRDHYTQDSALMPNEAPFFNIMKKSAQSGLKYFYKGFDVPFHADDKDDTLKHVWRTQMQMLGSGDALGDFYGAVRTHVNRNRGRWIHTMRPSAIWEALPRPPPDTGGGGSSSNGGGGGSSARAAAVASASAAQQQQQ